MKSSGLLLLFLAASVTFAQTRTGAKASTSTSKKANAGATEATGHGIPPVHGVVKTMFSERYEDYKIGTGALAEPNKLYRVEYTGYLAATGQQFDSSYDHRAPEMKDGKPVMGPDGKVVLGPAQPLVFPQGFGRLIPGFDQGFTGMRVGGKRRIFIPWELGYGTRDIPARPPEHPGIPPKSNLIFDVELIGVADMPKMIEGPRGGGPPHPGALPVRPVPPPAGANPGAAETPQHPVQPDSNSAQPK
jgi:peptidylprolyl isomerase